MAEPVGPIFVGGFQHIATDGYEMLYLPDLHNDELQLQGKHPVYYWMPNYVRLARHGGTGDYKFRMLHFVGVQSEGSTVGVSGEREVSGGVISFSTTAAPPPDVLKKAEDQLAEIFRGKDDRYWGWRTNVRPMFRPMPVVSSVTSLTNLSPLPNGSLPAIAPSSGNGNTRPGLSSPSAGAGPTRGDSGPGVRSFGLTSLAVPSVEMPRSVPLNRDASGTNLDPWYVNLQGQGAGTIDLLGESAFAGMVGSLPAALLWSSFHGSYSAMVVRQDMKLKFWAPMVHISMKGEWEKIFQHFSTAFQAHYLWASADIKLEFNNMRTNGTIKVVVEIDPTIPGADKLQNDIDKKTDLVYQKFMDAAQKMIFEPPPPNVEPAKADSGKGPWGVGFALKYRQDKTHLNLEYDETREMAYIQENVVSGTLEGFYNDIKADPQAEKKYFSTLYLSDWDRKNSRIIKPIVNWPDQSHKWIGEPVAFLSAQVGYPSSQGDIQWKARVFQATDPPDVAWMWSEERKDVAHVQNPPQGWTPDQTFIKRQIYFTEPPDELAYPYARCFVEKDVLDLDPGPNGRLTNENTIEVRADSAGKLSVGPITLGVVLEDAKQNVEVSFQCLGKTAEGNDRPVTKFSWSFANQDEPRFWTIFTGQLDFIPRYKYQVKVVVKGGLFSDGQEWTGEWIETTGNGPLIVQVPRPSPANTKVLRIKDFAAIQTVPPSAPGVPSTSVMAEASAVPPAVRALPEDVPEKRAIEVSGFALTPPAEIGSTGKSRSVDTRPSGIPPAMRDETVKPSQPKIVREETAVP